MNENKPIGGTIKISIATGVVHILSGLAALAFFLTMKYAAGAMEGAPYLIFFALFLAVFAVAGIIVFIIQFICGVGITVAGALQKKKLCAIFCGLPLLIDLVATFAATIVGFSLATSGLGGAVIFLGIDSLLLDVLSLAGIILSIITMVKNLSKKQDNQVE